MQNQSHRKVLLIIVLWLLVPPFSSLAIDPVIDRATLRGIKSVYVTVSGLGPKIQREGLTAYEIQKDVIEKLGYLDEDFGLAWHGSEVWTRKLRRLGYKTYVISNVFLFHYGHATANFHVMPDLLEHWKHSQAHLAKLKEKWRKGK